MKIIFYTILLLSSMRMTSQINRYSTITPSPSYQSLSYEEMSRVPLMLQKKYNENQKYLYELQKLILKIKPSITVDDYKKKLDVQYNYLEELEDADLARATKLLNQIDVNIRKIASEYMEYIENKQNVSYEKKTIAKRNYQNKENNYKKTFQYNNRPELHGKYLVYNYTAMYDSPNNNSKIVKHIRDSEYVNLLYRVPNTPYYKISINGTVGYIEQKFIKNK